MLVKSLDTYIVNQHRNLPDATVWQSHNYSLCHCSTALLEGVSSDMVQINSTMARRRR